MDKTKYVIGVDHAVGKDYSATLVLYPQWSDDLEVQQSMNNLAIKGLIAQDCRMKFLRYFNQLESLIMAIMLRAK